MTEDLLCPTGHGVIVKNGASLDCAGHRIVGGDASGQYGVYGTSVTGISVQNCTIERFEVGIRMRTATAATIVNNVIQHNTAYGIELTQSSTGALIQGNTITNNSDEGCHLSGPTDRDAAHRIVDNVVTNNSVEGLYLLNSDGNTIESNTISGHGTAGIYLTSSERNTITGNTLTNDPIQLANGSRLNTLRSNTVIGQRIKFDGSSSNTVYTTSVQGASGVPSSAFDFSASSNNQVVDSEARHPGDYHIRAAKQSKNNVFTRFTAVPGPLRCFVDRTSSVTVTDPTGKTLKCGK
jgi:parallel beta-helix repeat protein